MKINFSLGLRLFGVYVRIPLGGLVKMVLGILTGASLLGVVWGWLK